MITRRNKLISCNPIARLRLAYAIYDMSVFNVIHTTKSPKLLTSYSENTEHQNKMWTLMAPKWSTWISAQQLLVKSILAIIFFCDWKLNFQHLMVINPNLTIHIPSKTVDISQEHGPVCTILQQPLSNKIQIQCHENCLTVLKVCFFIFCRFLNKGGCSRQIWLYFSAIVRAWALPAVYHLYINVRSINLEYMEQAHAISALIAEPYGKMHVILPSPPLAILQANSDNLSQRLAAYPAKCRQLALLHWD